MEFNLGSYTPLSPGFANVQQSPQLSAALAAIGNGGNTTGVTALPTDLASLLKEIAGTEVKPNLMQNIGSGVSALGGLASIYLGLKASNLAAKDFEFQKQAYRDRLEGATKSYNTALRDRADNRAHMYGDASYADRYYNEHKLTPKGV